MGFSPIVIHSRRKAFSSGPETAGERFDPWIEVRRDHMRHNLEQIRQQADGRPVMAVIKANGYGHGLTEVAGLLESWNIHGLAVGKVDEAVHLREYGVRCPVLNFGPYTAEQAEEIVRLGISQSVFSESWPYLTKRPGKRAADSRIYELCSIHISGACQQKPRTTE